MTKIINSKHQDHCEEPLLRSSFNLGGDEATLTLRLDRHPPERSVQERAGATAQTNPQWIKQSLAMDPCLDIKYLKFEFVSNFVLRASILL
ncbi:MAG: hypothetical protein A2660_03165 [Candidatus Doudnabacteria bacterium RIFCSPHIGHO2_01_FULL_45_18]|uniref:Uncharacterized protein n=1 Tax=Candidatus Doudnabacteria bacterium RIFCSPHIGHO2_01_FULL_45_18 TaxID=1817823 RepID=A0A1F5NRZ4_9BACT|nr:MAG: hypothetical protein A2660_03165 [Candidatus Doudnabacteria bacterium RIFCSPHIGHO2_01_FULL_45_18]